MQSLPCRPYPYRSLCLFGRRFRAPSLALINMSRVWPRSLSIYPSASCCLALVPTTRKVAHVRDDRKALISHSEILESDNITRIVAIAGLPVDGTVMELGSIFRVSHPQAVRVHRTYRTHAPLSVGVRYSRSTQDPVHHHSAASKGIRRHTRWPRSVHPTGAIMEAWQS